MSSCLDGFSERLRFPAEPEACHPDRQTRRDSQATQDSTKLRSGRKSMGAPQGFAGFLRFSRQQECFAFNHGKVRLNVLQSFYQQRARTGIQVQISIQFTEGLDFAGQQAARRRSLAVGMQVAAQERLALIRNLAAGMADPQPQIMIFGTTKLFVKQACRGYVSRADNGCRVEGLSFFDVQTLTS